SARTGYLAIALRSMASRGWLLGWASRRSPGNPGPEHPMRLSPLGQSAVDQFDALGPWLDRLEASLAWAECLDAFVFEGHPHVEGAPSIDELCAQVEAGWGLDPKDEARVAPMLDGVVAAPLAVALGRRGVFGIEGR